MKSKQKISSTENLLETIRGKIKPETPAPVSGGGSGKSSPLAILSGAVGARGTNIGVEIGPEALRMVRMEITGGGPRLAAFKSFVYPGDLGPDSDKFASFLKASLQKFGVDAGVRIWTTVDAELMEVHQFKIPKTSGKALSAAAYWAMQREKKFNEQQSIFDYTLLGEVMDKGIPKLQVVCYLVQRSAIQARQRLFRQAGQSLAGISFEAAAINNLLNQTPAATSFDSLAHVCIDRESSRIDLFHQHNFLFSRNIKTGSLSFVQAIKDGPPGSLRPVAVAAAGPAPAAPDGDGPSPAAAVAGMSDWEANLAMDLADEPATGVGPGLEPALESASEPALEPALESALEPALEPALASAAEAAPEEAPVGGEINLELETDAAEPLTMEEAEQLFRAHLFDTAAAGSSHKEVMARIAPAVDRLVNQTERTLDYLSQTLGFERVEKLLLTGSAALFPGLAGYVEEQLAISTESLDPFAGVQTSEAMLNAPAAQVDRVLFAPALGLAMADSAATPNFLYTYREKELDRKNRLVRRAMAAGMVFLVVLTLGFYGWQSGIRSDHRTELDHLQSELASFNPDLNAAHMQQMFREIRQNKQDVDRSLTRHKSLAVLAEVSAAATPNVRLHSALLDAAERGQAGRGNLILNGFVSGDRQMLDSYLAGYIMRLQSTGLLGNTKLQQTSEEFYPGVGNVLKFTLSVQYS